MPPRKRRPKPPKEVEAFRHDEAKRPNLPSAEHQSVMPPEDQTPVRRAVERRNRDLDPQLVWRGKDGAESFEVQAPPLFIQEKVHPKALIDDLKRVAAEGKAPEDQASLFDDFNGLPSEEARTEFYQHEANWSNRMILGDSLQVMASLADREGYRGKVQCIYIDPPYGIKFNSNFQWSTTSKDVKDGKADHITREPEQVKAFRDTWRDGIHSYLSYLRDRLTMARELLTESGSVFVQIGDENVHRVRALMDEVFGEENFGVLITFQKTWGDRRQLPYKHFGLHSLVREEQSEGKSRQLKLPRRAGRTSLDRYDQYQPKEFSTRPLTKAEKAGDEKIDAAKRFQLFPLYSEGASEGASRE